MREQERSKLKMSITEVTAVHGDSASIGILRTEYVA